MVKTIHISHGDGRYTELTRCVGGWRRIERYPPASSGGLEWVDSDFHPSDDMKDVADAL